MLSVIVTINVIKRYIPINKRQKPEGKGKPNYLNRTVKSFKKIIKKKKKRKNKRKKKKRKWLKKD